MSEKTAATTKEDLDKCIEEEIRPFLNQDGGDIELVEYKDGVVRVHLQGACGTCPSSIMTLQFGIERRLKELFPDVQALELA